MATSKPFVTSLYAHRMMQSSPAWLRWGLYLQLAANVLLIIQRYLARHWLPTESHRAVMGVFLLGTGVTFGLMGAIAVLGDIMRGQTEKRGRVVSMEQSSATYEIEPCLRGVEPGLFYWQLCKTTVVTLWTVAIFVLLFFMLDWIYGIERKVPPALVRVEPTESIINTLSAARNDIAQGKRGKKVGKLARQEASNPSAF